MGLFDDNLDLRAETGGLSYDPFDEYANLKHGMGVAAEASRETTKSSEFYNQYHKKFVDEEAKPFLEKLDPFSVDGDDPKAWFANIDSLFKSSVEKSAEEGFLAGKRTKRKLRPSGWLNTKRIMSC